MPIREYAGAAKATALTGAIAAAATTINVVDATGWPTGAVGPFVVTINAGVTTEEKVLCSGRTGNSLAVQTRGFDGTIAVDHSGGTVQHTLSATDLREANAHVNDVSGDPHPQYLTAAEGAALYPPLTHSHGAATKTLRVPLDFTLLGSLTAGLGKGVVIPVPPSQTAVLTKLVLRTGSGSVTVRLSRNGPAVTSDLTVTSTVPAVVHDITDVPLADNDELVLSVIGVVSTASYLLATAYVDITV